VDWIVVPTAAVTATLQASKQHTSHQQPAVGSMQSALVQQYKGRHAAGQAAVINNIKSVLRGRLQANSVLSTLCTNWHQRRRQLAASNTVVSTVTCCNILMMSSHGPAIIQAVKQIATDEFTSKLRHDRSIVSCLLGQQHWLVTGWCFISTAANSLVNCTQHFNQPSAPRHMHSGRLSNKDC
jgi:hypothetical protein